MNEAPQRSARKLLWLLSLYRRGAIRRLFRQKLEFAIFMTAARNPKREVINLLIAELQISQNPAVSRTMLLALSGIPDSQLRDNEAFQKVLNDRPESSFGQPHQVLERHIHTLSGCFGSLRSYGLGRSPPSFFDRIAIFIIKCVSWLGAIVCIDAFLPKSSPVPSVWPEFFIGAAILLLGPILRFITRRSF